MVDAFVNAGGTINLVNDRRALVLHQLHASNTSSVTPQYRLPYFLLHQLFPGYSQYQQLLCQERSTGGWHSVASAGRARASGQHVAALERHPQTATATAVDTADVMSAP